MKRQPVEVEKIFAIHIRVNVQNIYKELIKLIAKKKKKKANNLLQMSKGLQQMFFSKTYKWLAGT